MEIVESLIKFLHVIVSLILIVAVLLQPGKGGDLGSMFGGGSSESVFGSSGAVPFLAKLTRTLGIVFFATSLSLGYFAISGTSSSVLKGENAPTDLSLPAEDGASDDVAAPDSVTNPEVVIDGATKPNDTIKPEEDSAEKQPE